MAARAGPAGDGHPGQHRNPFECRHAHGLPAHWRLLIEQHFPNLKIRVAMKTNVVVQTKYQPCNSGPIFAASNSKTTITINLRASHDAIILCHHNYHSTLSTYCRPRDLPKAICNLNKPEARCCESKCEHDLATSRTSSPELLLTRKFAKTARAGHAGENHATTRIRATRRNCN